MTAALGVSVAAILAASPAPSVERAIEVQGAGRVAVVLDRDAYDAAREDLGDLRVVAAAYRSVPDVLDRGSAATTRVTPRLIDRGFRQGRSEVVTLDFGDLTWEAGDRAPAFRGQLPAACRRGGER